MSVYFLAIQMVQISSKGTPRNPAFRAYFERRTAEGKNGKQIEEDLVDGIEEAVKLLSNIKIDDIKIPNNLGVEYTQYYCYIEWTDMEVYEPKKISMADFLGYQADVYNTQESTYVENFTYAIYAENLNETTLAEYLELNKGDIRDEIYEMEFNYKKYQPFREGLSKTIQAASCGTYSLGIAFCGYDLITDDYLTDEERQAYGLSGLIATGITIASLGMASAPAEMLLDDIITYGTAEACGSITYYTMLDIGASEKEARIAYGIANVSVGFTAAGLLKHYRELKKTGELVGKGTLIPAITDNMLFSTLKDASFFTLNGVVSA